MCGGDGHRAVDLSVTVGDQHPAQYVCSVRDAAADQDPGNTTPIPASLGSSLLRGPRFVVRVLPGCTNNAFLQFDGEKGEKVKEACAIFCRSQSYALLQLKVG